MTIARRGSRQLVVGDHQLRFSIFRKGVRGCPDCDALHVVIVHESRSGSVVQVCQAASWRPDVPITPRHIAIASSEALRAGWQPGAGKGVFMAIPWSDILQADAKLRNSRIEHLVSSFAAAYPNRFETAKDLANYGEFKLALEMVCDNIADFSIVPDDTQRRELLTLARLANLDPRYWSGFATT